MSLGPPVFEGRNLLPPILPSVEDSISESHLKQFPTSTSGQLNQNFESASTEENIEKDCIVGPDPDAPLESKVLSGIHVRTLEHNSVVCCVCFSNDGKRLATGSKKKSYLFDLATGDELKFVQLFDCLILSK
jgi:WD40 repeat protein